MSDNLPDWMTRGIDSSGFVPAMDRAIAINAARDKTLASASAPTNETSKIYYNPTAKKYWISGRAVPVRYDTLNYLANATDLPDQAEAPKGYVPIKQETLARYRDLVHSQMEGTAPTQFWAGLQTGVGTIISGVPRMLGFDVKNPLANARENAYQGMSLQEQAGADEGAFSSGTGFLNSAAQGVGTAAPIIAGAVAAGALAPVSAATAVGTGAGLALGFTSASGADSEQSQEAITQTFNDMSEDDRRSHSHSYATLRDHGVPEHVAIDQVAFTASQYAGVVGGLTTIPEILIGGKLVGNMIRKIPGLSKLGAEVADTATKNRLGLSGKAISALDKVPGPLKFLARTAAAGTGEGIQEETENATSMAAGNAAAGVGSSDPLDFVDGQNFAGGFAAGVVFGAFGGKGRSSDIGAALADRVGGTTQALETPPEAPVVPAAPVVPPADAGGPPINPGGPPINPGGPPPMDFQARAAAEDELANINNLMVTRYGEDWHENIDQLTQDPNASHFLDRMDTLIEQVSPRSTREQLFQQPLPFGDATGTPDLTGGIAPAPADASGIDQEVGPPVDAGMAPDANVAPGVAPAGVGIESLQNAPLPGPTLEQPIGASQPDPIEAAVQYFGQPANKLKAFFTIPANRRAIEQNPQAAEVAIATGLYQASEKRGRGSVALSPDEQKVGEQINIDSLGPSMGMETQVAPGTPVGRADALQQQQQVLADGEAERNAPPVEAVPVGEPPVETAPEPASDIKAQIANAAKTGGNVFVAPGNEAQIPKKLPQGMKAFVHRTNGILITKNVKVGAQFLASKSKTDAGRAKLLKLPMNKTQVNQQAAKAGVPVVAVQAKDAKGNTVAEAAAPAAGPGLAKVKKAIAKKVAGKSTIVVTTPEAVLTERTEKVAGEKGAAAKGKKAAPASAPPKAVDTKAKDKASSAQKKSSEKVAEPFVPVIDQQAVKDAVGDVPLVHIVGDNFPDSPIKSLTRSLRTGLLESYKRILRNQEGALKRAVKDETKQRIANSIEQTKAIITAFEKQRTRLDNIVSQAEVYVASLITQNANYMSKWGDRLREFQIRKRFENKNEVGNVIDSPLHWFPLTDGELRGLVSKMGEQARYDMKVAKKLAKRTGNAASYANKFLSIRLLSIIDPGMFTKLSAPNAALTNKLLGNLAYERVMTQEQLERAVTLMAGINNSNLHIWVTQAANAEAQNTTLGKQVMRGFDALANTEYSRNRLRVAKPITEEEAAAATAKQGRLAAAVRAENAAKRAAAEHLAGLDNVVVPEFVPHVSEKLSEDGLTDADLEVLEAHKKGPVAVIDDETGTVDRDALKAHNALNDEQVDPRVIDALRLTNKSHISAEESVPDEISEMGNKLAKLFQSETKTALPKNFTILSMKQARLMFPNRSELNDMFSAYFKAIVDGKEHHYIALNWGAFKPSVMLESFAHEFGHFAGRHAFDNSTIEVKAAVNVAFKHWLQANDHLTAEERLRESLLPATQEAVAGEKMDPSDEYTKLFDEFLATNTAKWLLTAAKPKSIVEKFFSRLAAVLRKLYALAVNKGKVQPDAEVKRMLDLFVHKAQARAAVSADLSEPLETEEKEAPISPKEKVTAKVNRAKLDTTLRDIGPLNKLINAILNPFVSTQTREQVSNWWQKSKLASTLANIGLHLMSTHQIADRYGNELRGINGGFGVNLRGLAKIQDVIDATAKHLQTRASNALAAALNMSQAAQNLMQKIMLDSTYYDMNPELGIGMIAGDDVESDGNKVIRSNKHILKLLDSKGKPVDRSDKVLEVQRRRYEDLRATWDKLLAADPNAAQIYKELRDSLEELRKNTIETKRDNLMKAKADKGYSVEAIDKVIADHEAELATHRAGPYFPLMRFGDWIVKVSLPSELYGKGGLLNENGEDMTRAEANKEAADLRERFRGSTVKVENMGEGNYAVRVHRYGVRFYDSESEAYADREKLEKEVRDEYQVRGGDYDTTLEDGVGLDDNVEEESEGGDTKKAIITKPYKKLDFYNQMMAPPNSEFQRSLTYLMGSEDVSSAFKSSVDEMLLQSLPEFSSRKSELNRSSIMGASKEMFNAYSRRVGGAAHTLATIQNSKKLHEYWDNMIGSRKDFPGASDIIHVLNKNAQLVRDRTAVNSTNKILNTISDINSLYTLGFSPMYIITNALQVRMITTPYLAAMSDKKGNAIGWVKSSKYINDAYSGALTYFSKRGMQDFMEELNKLQSKATKGTVNHADEMIKRFAVNKDGTPNEAEAKMLQHLLDGGRLDFSFLNSMQDAMRAGNVDGKLGMTMRLGMAFPQQVEAMNRVVTALATHRMAVAEKGMAADSEELNDFVSDVVLKTQLDYSRRNRPVLFNYKLTGIALQFRLYMQGMYMLFVENSIKALSGQREGESHKDFKLRQAEGFRTIRNLMMTHMAVGGTTGISPIVWMATFPLKVLGAAAATVGLGDDDEDRWKTLDDMMQGYATDMFGKTGAQVLMHGLPTLVNLDVSDRLGLPDLLDTKYMGVSPRDTPGNILDKTLLYAAGSPYSNIKRVLNATGDLGNSLSSTAKGQWGDAADSLQAAGTGLPTGVRALHRAFVYAKDGILDRDGDVFKDKKDLGFGTLAATALGGQTADVSTAYKNRSAEKNAKGKMMIERNAILKAWRGGDADRREQLQSRIEAFNKSVPTHFQLTSKTFSASVKAAEERNSGEVNKQDAEVSAMFGR